MRTSGSEDFCKSSISFYFLKSKKSLHLILIIMKNLILLLIPLILLSSCTIDWHDEKNKQNINQEFYRTPEWILMSKEVSKLGFSLKEWINQITLIHNWNELIGWHYTEDRNPPVPIFHSWSCTEIEESLKIKWTGTTLTSIWDKMPYEAKRDCIKENIKNNMIIQLIKPDLVSIKGMEISPNPNREVRINSNNDKIEFLWYEITSQ